jgi:hypothetical protein
MLVCVAQLLLAGQQHQTLQETNGIHDGCRPEAGESAGPTNTSGPFGRHGFIRDECIW